MVALIPMEDKTVEDSAWLNLVNYWIFKFTQYSETLKGWPKDMENHLKFCWEACDKKIEKFQGKIYEWLLNNTDVTDDIKSFEKIQTSLLKENIKKIKL